MQKFRQRLRHHNLPELRRRERANNLHRKYGITEADYAAMVAQQANVCAICGKLPTSGRGKKLHVDHSHTTGKIRGLLCGPCNTSLGGFRDDSTLLQKAINYLKRERS